MSDDTRAGDGTATEIEDRALSETPDLMERRSPVGVMDPEVQATLHEQRSRARRGWRSFSQRDEPSLDGVPSTAAIGGHPIHPMLVPIPIGLFVGALASDIAYVATRDRFWARAARALTAGGVVSGLLSAAFGATDFLTRREIRELPIAWLHAGGNVLVVTLGTASVAARAQDPERGVLPVGLALSLASGSLLLVTGWLGGELVYRHRIALSPMRAR
ncbi:MAG TPA: DUF2231 domain-containing protein [Candidatus Limnocylindrales bacterium]|nr:DUF2231 domain-containing protein [Candidatus Limnocylindrales bacterium]